MQTLHTGPYKKHHHRHHHHRPELSPLYVKGSEIEKNFLGFMELTTDEQLAKKIYEATGDVTFKGFLPFTWNTDQITKMRDVYQQLNATGKPVTAFNMALKLPSISQTAHQYFITNFQNIKGILPDNIQIDPGAILKSLNPILIVAGLAAGAIILMQIVPLIPKKKQV